MGRGHKKYGHRKRGVRAGRKRKTNLPEVSSRRKGGRGGAKKNVGEGIQIINKHPKKMK